MGKQWYQRRSTWGPTGTTQKESTSSAIYCKITISFGELLIFTSTFLGGFFLQISFTSASSWGASYWCVRIWLCGSWLLLGGDERSICGRSSYRSCISVPRYEEKAR